MSQLIVRDGRFWAESFCNKSFEQECQEVREGVELAVEANVLVA